MSKMNGGTSTKSILSYEELIGLKTLNCKCDRESVNKDLFVPQLKYNIFYIVAAILINEHGEVLLIQESKPSCYEKWYLPAGRVESNESLADAAKREVLEEAGLLFEPQSLLCVEMKSHYWARFTFIGRVVGGKLKTLEESDPESLQAKWFSWPFVNVDFRKSDILHLIDKGQEFTKENSALKMMPVIKQHHCFCVRIVFTFKRNDCLFVLQTNDNDNAPYLPSFSVNPNKSLLDSIKSSLAAYCVFDIHDLNMKIVGLNGIEHSGDSRCNKDGILFSLLIKTRGENLPVLTTKACWRICDNSVENQVVSLVEL